MSRLDVLDAALLALAVLLHDHGPACVCGPCTAYAQATALLPRLGHVLAILQAWARGDADDWIQPQDIGLLLGMLDNDRATAPKAAGEGGG